MRGDRESSCCWDSCGILHLFYFLYGKTAEACSAAGPEFPACKILMAPGTPGPHGIAKAPVKASGKLEHLCRSSEHPFHLKLSATGAVTESNSKTNINSLIILCSEMCSLIMTVKLFEAGMSLCVH